MSLNQFEIVVALFFQSSAMIDVIKYSFEQHLKFFSLSASDDLQVLLMTSASGPLVFRTSFLQMLQASFLLIPLLSFVLSEPML